MDTMPILDPRDPRSRGDRRNTYTKLDRLFKEKGKENAKKNGNGQESGKVEGIELRWK